MQSITKLIKITLKKVLSHLPSRNVILFESYPVFSDNTRAVYEHLIKKGKEEKYRYIWIDTCRDTYIPEIRNKYTKIISVDRNKIWGKVVYNYFIYQAKVLVSGNIVFKKVKEKQYQLFVSHGTALKDCSAYYHLNDDVDECLSVSPFFVQYDSKNLGISKEKILSYGFPRTDCFFDKKHLDLKSVFPNCDFEKVIMWMPTFRKHKNGEICGSDVIFPVIHDRETAIRVNEFAKERKVLLIILPHFSQEFKYGFLDSLSNIRVIDNDFLLRRGLILYRIIKETDAMLTDYSSVIVDYLLLNKPIGLCFEDYNEYKKNIGFADNAEQIFSCGMRLYTENDLCSFINDVIRGNDILKDKREKVIETLDFRCDGKASERTADHILNILKKTDE